MARVSKDSVFRAFRLLSRPRSAFKNKFYSTEAAAVVKDYEEYRRALYGEITHKAVLVDAVGTLVVPSQPMAQIYKQIGEKYGVKYSEKEILDRYRWAYEQPWGKSRLRYVDDGRPFWQFIVSSSTGCSDSEYFEELYHCSDSEYFEELYHYYTTDKAWHLCDPEAENVFKALRKSGVKSAVVSNFDTRLRPLLQALKCDHWFDAIAVSAEISITWAMDNNYRERSGLERLRALLDGGMELVIWSSVMEMSIITIVIIMLEKLGGIPTNVDWRCFFFT